MEEQRITDLAIDSLWYLTKEQVDFFNNKVSLTFAVFSEIISGLTLDSNTQLSAYDFKRIFEEQIVTPFTSAKQGADMAIKYNQEDAYTIFDGSMLNIRGMARIRIVMGIVNNEQFDINQNNDIHYAVSNPLQYLTFNNTPFAEKGLFEVLANFIEARPQLINSDERTIANLIMTTEEYSPLISALNDAFERHIVNLILRFEQEVRHQSGDRNARELVYTLYKKLSKQFSREDFASKTILASDFVQNLINEYKK